jgi:CheY-like chemotaxis protein
MDQRGLSRRPPGRETEGHSGKTAERFTLRPVLLVEDDWVDARVVKRAFAELNAADALVHVTHGEGALAYLQNSRTSPPCLVLLDLDLPGVNGLDVLGAMRADEALSQIPVWIFTASENPRDREMSLRLGAAGYVTKPFDYRDTLEAIRTIVGRWPLSCCPQPSGRQEFGSGPYEGRR